MRERADLRGAGAHSGAVHPGQRIVLVVRQLILEMLVHGDGSATPPSAILVTTDPHPVVTGSLLLALLPRGSELIPKELAIFMLWLGDSLGTIPFSLCAGSPGKSWYCCVCTRFTGRGRVIRNAYPAPARCRRT